MNCFYFHADDLVARFVTTVPNCTTVKVNKGGKAVIVAGIKSCAQLFKRSKFLTNNYFILSIYLRISRNCQKRLVLN